MGWILAGSVVLLLVVIFLRESRNAKDVREKIGIKPGEKIDTVTGLSYLGGHPLAPSPAPGCILTLSQRKLAIVRSRSLVFQIPRKEIQAIVVETEEEAHQRVTATRLLALGIFAFAFKQKVKGSVVITIETSRGPILLEKSNSSKSEVRALMAPISARLAARPPVDPNNTPLPKVVPQGRSVADEIGKLVKLKQDGSITSAEYDSAKQKLIR